MGWLSDSLKFTGDVMGGGFLRDGLKGLFGGGKGGKISKIIGQERESDRAFGEAARGSIVKGITAQREGFDQAKGAASDASRGLRREVLKQGQTAQNELIQRYGAGGKFATTALDNARMGLASSLTADLEMIDSGFAKLLGELSIGQGAAEMQGQGMLANLDMARSDQESELYRLLIDKRNSKPGMSQWLSLLGSGAGLAIGGPTGAAVGGELGNIVGGSMEPEYD